MWKVVHKCVNCKGVLNNTQRMYSGGCCPLCGYIGPHAGTIVDTVSSSIKVQPQPKQPSLFDRWFNRKKPTVKVVIFEDASAHEEEWDEFSEARVRTYLANHALDEDDGFDIITDNIISVPCAEGPHYIFIKQ